MLIQPYTAEWVKDFEKLKLEIKNGLSGLEYNIEHVGSTSIPHLGAKPIIDIDIIYNNNSEFEKIKSGLIQIGYYHNGNQGIIDREVFKRNGMINNKILDSITHHLYVCPENSEALERHLLMRDYLRKNEWARLDYQAKKYEIAEKANQNKKLYAELKELHVNEFIDSIVEVEKQKNVAKLK